MTTAAPAICEKRARSPQELGELGITAVREWTAIAASASAARDLLASTYGISRGSVYTSPQGETPDEGCVCQSIPVTALIEAPPGGEGLYELSALFSPINASGEPGAPSVPGGPPVYRIERTLVNSPVDHDKDGNPLVNRADEPFTDVTKIETIKVLVIEWWIEASDLLTLDLSLSAYEGKINGAVWKGAAIGSLFCRELKAEGQSPTAGRFRVIGKWEYKPPKTLFGKNYEGWDYTVLNFGTRQRVYETLAGGGGTVVTGWSQIPDDNTGGPLLSPVPLDEDGLKAASGAQPVVLSFKLYEYADFSALGI